MSHCFIDLVTLSELALEAMLSCVMTKWSLVNNVLQMVHTLHGGKGLPLRQAQESCTLSSRAVSRETEPSRSIVRHVFLENDYATSF